MYINCISCGHKFDIGKSYDDYEGPVRCPTCRGMLTIRTEDGSIRSVRPGLVYSEAPGRGDSRGESRESGGRRPETVAQQGDGDEPGTIRGDFNPERRSAA